MATTIILPKLDEAMVKGKVAKWLKKEGDTVNKGEGIVQIETEKVTFEIEAEESGILGKILAKEGEELPVGTVIAYIIQPGEKVPETPAETGAPAKETAQVPKPVTAAREKVTIEVPEAPKEGRAIKASPLARKIARENSLDISRIKGTGPAGRIVRDDVMRAIQESKVAAYRPGREEATVAEDQIVPLSSMRKIIASRMTESFQSPHFYLTVEADSKDLVKTNKQLAPIIEKKTGIRTTITDLLIMMVAKALEDNPPMNCAYVDGSAKLFKRIDIGLVTSVEGGLIVPVIRQANRKSLTEIAQARADLVQRARDGKLSMAEMKGSTFTISNLGMYGIDQFSAILQPPEAAILAVGRIADKAVVRDGQIVARPIMTMTLSIDHRILDGAIGAQFLQSLTNYIENPALLVLSQV